MIVGINCGHTVSGTVGSGAVGFLNESNETRRVGYKVMEYLRAKGVTVVDCTDDYSSTVSGNLKKIVDKAYEIGVREVCVVPLESGGRAKVNTQLAFQEDDVEELRAFYKDVVQWFDEKYGETDMVLCTPNMLNIGDEGRYAKVFDSSGIMPACGAGKIHCTVDPYGDVKLCPSDEHVLKEEKNNLLEKDIHFPVSSQTNESGA